MFRQLSRRGVVSGHLERSQEICHYYWPVALFPLTDFSSSQAPVGGLGDGQTVAFSFQTPIHHIRCRGLWSGPTDISLCEGAAFARHRLNTPISTRPSNPPPSFFAPPVASHHRFFEASERWARRRPRGRTSIAFPRGRRRTHRRQCFPCLCSGCPMQGISADPPSRTNLPELLRSSLHLSIPSHPGTNGDPLQKVITEEAAFAALGYFCESKGPSTMGKTGTTIQCKYNTYYC